MKLRIFKNELSILAALDFEIIFVHPYRYLARYIIKKHLARTISHNAWDLIGDIITVPEIILRFQPEAIASAALFIASCLCQHKLESDWITWFNGNSTDTSGEMDVIKDEENEKGDEEFECTFNQNDEDFSTCHVTLKDIDQIMGIYFNALKCNLQISSTPFSLLEKEVGLKPPPAPKSPLSMLVEQVLSEPPRSSQEKTSLSSITTTSSIVTTASTTNALTVVGNDLTANQIPSSYSSPLPVTSSNIFVPTFFHTLPPFPLPTVQYIPQTFHNNIQIQHHNSSQAQYSLTYPYHSNNHHNTINKNIQRIRPSK